MGVIDVTLHPGNNNVVRVEFRTPYGTLKFRVDTHGKRLPDLG